MSTENKVTIDADILALKNVASKDKTRLGLTGINIENGLAVACNGHCLAVRKVNQDNHTPGTYEVSGVKLAKGQAAATFTGNGDGKLYAEGVGGYLQKIDYQYPEYKQVISNKEPVITITLNATLLYNLSLALNRGNKKANAVTLEISSATDAIRVTVGDENALGIIMPMKLDGPRGLKFS